MTGQDGVARRRSIVVGAALGGILVVAATLRFWALDMGLPNPAARPDEREMLSHTIAFAAGDLNPRWFVYPNLFMYAAWLWIELGLTLRRLWVPTAPYAQLMRGDLPLVLLYGRTMSAVVGTATVAIVYQIGRAVDGRRLGLVAAALLATNFLHVRDSHALKTETLLAAGTLVSLWLLARRQEHPGLGRAALAGVAIGITAGFKYPGLFLLATAWIVEILASPRRGLRRALPGFPLLVLGATAVVTFLATSPFLVLDFGRAKDTAAFLSLALYATRSEDPRPAGGLLTTILWWLRSRAFWYHLAASLRHGSGIVLALATPVALVRAVRDRAHPFFVLAAVHCIVHYLIAGASPVHLARYLTPLMPVLMLLVAALVTSLTARIAGPARRDAATAILTLLLVAEPAASSIAANVISARTDTRVLATRWMTDHLPAGTVVAQLGDAVVPIANPELPPGVRRAVLPAGATDLAAAGVTFVTTHEHQLPFSQLDPRQLQALGPHLALLAEFSPYVGPPAGVFEREDAYYVPFWSFSGVVRPGPLVRIYAYRP